MASGQAVMEGLLRTGVVPAAAWLLAGWGRFLSGAALLVAALVLGAWWLRRARRRRAHRAVSPLCPACGRGFESEGALYAHSVTAHFGDGGSPGR